MRIKIFVSTIGGDLIHHEPIVNRVILPEQVHKSKFEAHGRLGFFLKMTRDNKFHFNLSINFIMKEP